MKLFITSLLVLFAFPIPKAQNTTISNNIIARQTFTLNGKKVLTISTDSSGNSKDADKLITERAIKLYVDGLFSNIGGSQGFQEVTDINNVTTNEITIANNLNIVSGHYGYTSIIRNPDITADNILYIPNKSGTIALLDDIADAAQGLQEVINNNNILNQDNTVSYINHSLTFNGDYLTIQPVQNGLGFNFDGGNVQVNFNRNTDINFTSPVFDFLDQVLIQY